MKESFVKIFYHILIFSSMKSIQFQFENPLKRIPHVYENSHPGLDIINVLDYYLNSENKNRVPPVDFNKLEFELRRDSKMKNNLYIDPKTKILKTSNSPIDREDICNNDITCSVEISIALIQPINYVYSFSIKLIIIDINDNFPKFETDEINLEISESSEIGTKLGLPEASDLDSSINGLKGFNITYSTCPDKFDLFVEKFSEGDFSLSLNLINKIDREILSFCKLTITAYDGGDEPKNGELKINLKILDANDNSPVFTKPFYNVTIEENFPINVTFLQIEAIDSDEGLNGLIVYQLSKKTQESFPNMFYLNSDNGQLSLLQFLDYEERFSYFLSVVAIDRGINPIEAQARVHLYVLDVNDNAPEISVFSYIELLENSVENTFLAHVSVLDRDSGNNGLINCKLEENSLFFGEQIFILQQIGQNGEYKLTTGKFIFNREGKDSFNLTLFCEDNGITKMNSTKNINIFILDVNDNAPVFEKQVYKVNLTENNKINEFLLTLSITDLDIGNNAKITFKACNETANEDIKVGRETGEIFVMRSFDYEKERSLNICIAAEDSGEEIRLTSFTTIKINILDENDNGPIFDNNFYYMEILENSPNNSIVGIVRTYDLDSKDIYKRAYYFMEEITSNYYGNDFIFPFRIDKLSGEIKTLTVLDRELKDFYNFSVLAVDQFFPYMNSSTYVMVSVQDANDNKPLFINLSSSYNITIFKFSESPVNVAQIQAYDKDKGQNSLIKYEIIKESQEGLFIIDSKTGMLQLILQRLSFIYQEIPLNMNFDLVISATDHGLIAKSNIIKITIFININNDTDMNPILFKKFEFSPFFTEINYEIILIMAGCAALIILLFLILLIILIRKRKIRKKHDLENFRANHYLQNFSSAPSLKNSDKINNNFKELNLNVDKDEKIKLLNQETVVNGLPIVNEGQIMQYEKYFGTYKINGAANVIPLQDDNEEIFDIHNDNRLFSKNLTSFVKSNQNATDLNSQSSLPSKETRFLDNDHESCSSFHKESCSATNQPAYYKSATRNLEHISKIKQSRNMEEYNMKPDLLILNKSEDNHIFSSQEIPKMLSTIKNNIVTNNQAFLYSSNQMTSLINRQNSNSKINLNKLTDHQDISNKISTSSKVQMWIDHTLETSMDDTSSSSNNHNCSSFNNQPDQYLLSQLINDTANKNINKSNNLKPKNENKSDDEVGIKLNNCYPLNSSSTGPSKDKSFKNNSSSYKSNSKPSLKINIKANENSNGYKHKYFKQNSSIDTNVITEKPLNLIGTYQINKLNNAVTKMTSPNLYICPENNHHSIFFGKKNNTNLNPNETKSINNSENNSGYYVYNKLNDTTFITPLNNHSNNKNMNGKCSSYNNVNNSLTEIQLESEL